MTNLKNNNREIFLTKFLRFGIYITAFMPLIIFKDYISPFHFGKILIFRSLVEVLGAAYLILILKDRAYLPRPNKIFWSFAVFTMVFGLTTVTSSIKYPSFWGFLERMGGLWTFGHYFLFFIILTSVFNKIEHWQKLFDLTIFTGILSALYGFGQKTNLDFFIGSGGRERIFGTIGNPALFAGYELFISFLSLTLFFNAKNSNYRKAIYLSAFVLTSIALLSTAVRGSILGFTAGITVFAYLLMKYKGLTIGKVAFKTLVGLALAFIAFSSLFSDSSFVKKSRYFSRITDLSLTSVTVQTRVWAWEAGLKGWIESPKTIMLGWGPENFNIPFSKHFNPKFFVGSGSETLFDRAHNIFVEILVTMGAVGLAAYIFIFVVLFSSLKKLLRDNGFSIYGAGIIAMTIAYLIHNSFIFDTAPNFIVFFTILGFVSYASFIEKEREGITGPLVRNKSFIFAATAVLIALTPVLIYTTNILPAKANYATTRGIISGRQGNFNEAAVKFKEALSYDVPGKYEYRHRLAQYLVGVGGPSVKEKKVRELFEYAISEIDKNINENQIDYLPYLYVSRLNILLGKDDPKSEFTDRALNYSHKALKLSPTFIRTYYEVAQAYLNKKDYPKAIEFFQKAVDLNPSTGLSYWYLGAAKIESGDLNGIKDLEESLNVKNIFNPSEQDYLMLINIYIKKKDFAKIAEIYEKIIVINPENPQHYASLATAYANLGRIDEAEKMARKSAEVDPSFEPDAREFLKTLGRRF